MDETRNRPWLDTEYEAIKNGEYYREDYGYEEPEDTEGR